MQLMSGIRGTRRPREAQRLLGFGSAYVLIYNARVVYANTVLAIDILSTTRRMYLLRDEADKAIVEIFYYVEGNPASFLSPATD